MAQRFICVGKKQSKKFDFLCGFAAKVVDALHNCRIVADARNFQGLFWRYKDSAALKDKSASMFASAHKRVKYIILYHATLAHSDFFFSKMEGRLTGRAGL